MSERRFVLVDFTHMSREGCPRLYEAGRTYALPRAHRPRRHQAAAARRHTVAAALDAAELVPAAGVALTEAEVVEGEAELRALRRHALEVVDPKRNLRDQRDAAGRAPAMGAAPNATA